MQYKDAKYSITYPDRPTLCGNNGSLRNCQAVREVLQIPPGTESTAGVYKRLHGLSHHQLVRRVALSLGLRFSDFCHSGALTTDAVARLCGATAAAWAAAGFPASQTNLRSLDVCIRALVEWALPADARAARENPTVWKLLGALSSLYGLCHLSRVHGRKPHARAILRAFPPAVQQTLLHGRFGRPWVDYLAALTASIWEPAFAPDEALCYVAFSSRTSMWYVGKSTSSRTRHGSSKPGWLERFREHLLATRRRSHPQAHRERYKAWAAADYTCVHMVPFVWVSNAEVYWLESLASCLLQPPSQSNATTADRVRERPRRRPWPSQRQRPALHTEARLCLAAQIAAAPRATARAQPCGLDYPGLVQAARDHWGWPKAVLSSKLYGPGGELFLAVHLAEARSRLCYERAWRRNNPAEWVLRVLEQSRRFDKGRAQRVQGKLRRFCAIGLLLPTRACWVKLPTADKALCGRVKAALGRLLARALQGTSPRLRAHFRGLVRVVPGTAGNTGQYLADQIHWARAFRLDFLDTVDKDAREFYEKRLDVVKLPYHVSFPKTADPERVWGTAHDTVAKWAAASGLGAHTHLWRELCARGLAREPSPSDPAASVTQWIRDHTQGRLLATLDRDTKRRASMDPAGYLYRLYRGYLQDAAFYAHRTDLSPEVVAADRTVRMLEQLPRWIQVRRELTAEELPYAYHNYKGECLADGPTTGADGQEHPQGLTCGKDHAHEREVVAAALDPLPPASACAVERCALPCARRSPQAGRSGTRPSLPRRWRPRSSTCGTGTATPALALAVPSGPSRSQSSRSTRPSSSRTPLQTARSGKPNSCSGTWRARRGPRAWRCATGDGPSAACADGPETRRWGCRYIPTADVLQAMRFCAGDKWFVVGDQVVERTKGWPMGGPVSSPCTSLDLETAIARFYRDPKTAERIGWHVDGFTPAQLVQGLLHVDDAIALSKVLCVDCLFRGVEQLWPEDVGVSLEGSGGNVPFLHVEVQATGECTAAPVRIIPIAHNREFARGTALLPAFSKLPPYIGKEVTPKRRLAEYVWTRIASHDQVLRHSAEAAVEPLAELVTEAVRLQWPGPTVASVLRALPRTHTSDLAVLVRRMGARLKRSNFRGQSGQQVFQSCSAAAGECLAHMWAGAGVTG